MGVWGGGGPKESNTRTGGSLCLFSKLKNRFVAIAAAGDANAKPNAHRLLTQTKTAQQSVSK